MLKIAWTFVEWYLILFTLIFLSVSWCFIRWLFCLFVVTPVMIMVWISAYIFALESFVPFWWDSILAVIWYDMNESTLDN